MRRFPFLSMLLLLVALPAGAVDTGRLILDYDIYGGGFHALEAHMALTMGSSDYRIEMDAQTTGFVGFLFPLTAKTISEGTISADRLIPRKYALVSSFRGKDKSAELLFDDTGAFLERRKSNGEIKTAPEDVWRGTTDILTGVVQSMRGTVPMDGCPVEVQLFDGKRRIHASFADKGMERLASSRYTSFDGMARKCVVELEPVAGDINTKAWFWNREGNGKHPAPIEVWVAVPDEDAPPVPVRIRANSTYGTIIAHLSGIETI